MFSSSPTFSVYKVYAAKHFTKVAYCASLLQQLSNNKMSETMKKVRFCKARLFEIQTYNSMLNLMIWSKEPLNSWLLSLLKQTQVTALLWACSNLFRHVPFRILQTWNNKMIHLITYVTDWMEITNGVQWGRIGNIVAIQWRC